MIFVYSWLIYNFCYFVILLSYAKNGFSSINSVASRRLFNFNWPNFAGTDLQPFTALGVPERPGRPLIPLAPGGPGLNLSLLKLITKKNNMATFNINAKIITRISTLLFWLINK